MKRLSRVILAITGIVTLFSGRLVNSREYLTVGAIPDQNPEKLNRLYTLLTSELNSQLGVPVKYVPVINYSAAVSAFRTGSLDLVWFGGLTGVQARLQTPGSRILAQRDIDKNFRSVFIANKSTGISKVLNVKDLRQLKGKRFTYGSESSTSGRLMPQHFIQVAKLTNKDFKGGYPGFSGSHDSTLLLVQSGSYDAGALNEQVWKSRKKEGSVDLTKVQAIWRTPPYVDYHWLAQPDLDRRFGENFTAKLKSVILGLNYSSKRQAEILRLFGAKRFISAKDSEYKIIEKIGRSLGKIK